MEPQKVPTIFINPKFKNAYINPNFLKTNPNTIHVNPKFLQQQQVNSQNLQLQTQASSLAKPTVPASSSIIKNTKRSLIRAPTKIEISNSSTNVSQGQKFLPTQVTRKMNLIKISNTKLVNASHLMKAQQKENEIIKKATESIIKTKKLMKKSEPERSIYKLDRTKSSPGIGKKKKKIVSTYSIRRVESSDKLSPKNVRVTGQKLLKSGNSSGQSSKNKKLLMVNINGVQYKSTSNKLEKSSITPKKLTSSAPNTKMLIIRGQKFVLDPSGTKLKRDNEASNINLSRIDIGGLTYKKKASNGSYERDNSHQVRNHLTIAKIKSISVLQRGKLQVSNVICPIYRRLGKCLSYANGRCSKIHDPRYVVVCPNFIKGTCENEKCLLSHNANFHKMPVCKYYLKGLCAKSKEECLYLHKKLTDGTKLCVEFVKGYCPLADKCNLQHDFPDTGNKAKYSLVKKKKVVTDEKKKEAPTPSNTPISLPPAASDARYFDESSSSSQTIQNIPKATKTAPLLPDFIKI